MEQIAERTERPLKEHDVSAKAPLGRGCSPAPHRPRQQEISGTHGADPQICMRGVAGVVARRVLGLTLAVVAVQLALALALSLHLMISPSQQRPPLFLVLGVIELVGILGTALLAGQVARRHVRGMRHLHVQEQRVAADARNTSEWLWESDLNGVFTYSNGRVEALLGYTSGEVVGRTTSDFVVDGASRP